MDQHVGPALLPSCTRHLQNSQQDAEPWPADPGLHPRKKAGGCCISGQGQRGIQNLPQTRGYPDSPSSQPLSPSGALTAAEPAPRVPASGARGGERAGGSPSTLCPLSCGCHTPTSTNSNTAGLQPPRRQGPKVGPKDPPASVSRGSLLNMQLPRHHHTMRTRHSSRWGLRICIL